ncbi:hypothetical protein BDP27DRAFT_1315143 [Rhodocollybia butyracea]|uniref:Uncharacterized protein n=1 Tax=Rhodocollybia butyracea TaxID=206335 RepID=A0A9P5UDT1_9AGAR|nr:hypothetical protein BDP27DRAFT_1315143 [Rhodocollybia butyracea]
MEKLDLTPNSGLTELLSSVPETLVEYSIELESYFCARNLCSTDLRTTFPSGLHRGFYDDPPESDSEDGQDAQYIYIPFSSPFYRPLLKSRPFACDLSDFSFSCDVLSDEGPCSMQTATLFHEALSPDLGGLFDIDTECLQGLEKNLLLRPMEILEQSLFDSMSSNLHGANMDSLKSFPDVPEGVEIEFDYDRESSDSEFSSEDDELEERTLYFSQNVLVAASSLDRPLVAPFDDNYNLHTLLQGPLQKLMYLASNAPYS